MAKSKLGDNPLKAMLHGKTPSPQPQAKTKASEAKTAASSVPKIRRKSASTTTAGGYLRRSAYFTEDEWAALRKKAYEEDRPIAEILRECVRAHLKMDV